MSSWTPFLFFSFLTFSATSQATVPHSGQFKFVNEGEYAYYITEYNADYRPLDVAVTPFQLCFYNTTPNAYTLALRMGTRRSESRRMWVWEANRGNPVRENATLTFGGDGNLVLAEADGKIVWQTATANKGVVGFQLLSNGNMVLHDSAGNYIWQSFDHPTDTLLVGQSLRATGPTTLVSRLSEEENKNGPYSLVLEPRRLALYYKSVSSPRPLLYFTSSEWITLRRSNLEYVTFNCEEADNGFAYYLLLNYNTTNGILAGGRYLTRPNYNATLSYLRLGIDGNVRIYTYNDNVDIGAWEETFTLFDRDSEVPECQLPQRCGEFGLCDDNQCVACPTPNGLEGWSKACEAPKVGSCSAKDFHYFKLVGVDHFMIRYRRGDGPVKESECGSKCTRDCKCKAYFYHQLTSRCWIAYDLMTLTNVANSTHLAYIKAPNH